MRITIPDSYSNVTETKQDLANMTCEEVTDMFIGRPNTAATRMEIEMKIKEWASLHNYDPDDVRIKIE